MTEHEFKDPQLGVIYDPGHPQGYISIIFRRDIKWDWKTVKKWAADNIPQGEWETANYPNEFCSIWMKRGWWMSSRGVEARKELAKYFTHMKLLHGSGFDDYFQACEKLYEPVS